MKQSKVVLHIIGIFFLSISSLNAQSSLEKGKTLYESKKYAEAVKILESVSDEARDYATARYYLGRIAFDKKEYDDAAEYFEEATEANPKEAEYFICYGNACAAVAKTANVFTQGSMAIKLRKAWEKAIELDPSNVEARVSLIGFYAKAPGLMGGSINNAKAMATDVIRLSPAEGHWQMGSILSTEKNNLEAEKEFSKMIKADPSYIRNLASYYSDQKQYDKAFEMFEETLKKNPNDFVTLYRFGKASAISGLKLERGEECLRKYLTYDPTYNEPSMASAYVRLGQIKEKKGSKAEAKKFYESALKQDNDMKDAREGLERTSK